MIFERKIMRKIFGPTKELSLWRIKTNDVIDDLIQRKNVIRFVKFQRLKQLGHVERMPKEREVTRIYKWQPFASIPIGRAKNRWEDDVRKDMQTMKIKNWTKSVLNRDLWKTIVERTKTDIELKHLSRTTQRILAQLRNTTTVSNIKLHGADTCLQSLQSLS
jgi:DNA phosphorothioation-dependent restriction protein DptG